MSITPFVHGNSQYSCKRETEPNLGRGLQKMADEGLKIDLDFVSTTRTKFDNFRS